MACDRETTLTEQVGSLGPPQPKDSADPLAEPGAARFWDQGVDSPATGVK